MTLSVRKTVRHSSFLIPVLLLMPFLREQMCNCFFWKLKFLILRVHSSEIRRPQSSMTTAANLYVMFVHFAKNSFSSLSVRNFILRLLLITFDGCIMCIDNLSLDYTLLPFSPYLAHLFRKIYLARGVKGGNIISVLSPIMASLKGDNL